MDSYGTALCHAVYQHQQVIAGRYYIGNRTIEETNGSPLVLSNFRFCQNNVPLLQGRSQSSTETFSSYRILSVPALGGIAPGVELLVHYRSMYKFHRWSIP